MTDAWTIVVSLVGALTAAVSAIAAMRSAKSAADTHKATVDSNRAHDLHRTSLLIAACGMQAARIESAVVECRQAYKAAEIFSGSSNNSGIALAIQAIEDKGARARSLADGISKLPTPAESVPAQIQIAIAHSEVEAIYEDIVQELRLVRDDNAEHRRLRLANMYRPQEPRPP